MRMGKLLAIIPVAVFVIAGILLVALIKGRRAEEAIDRVSQVERQKMVETQIVSRGITDEKVLQAMRTVPRHLFVDESQRIYAYEDRPLPIPCGQTISQPYIVALMTELLKLRGGEKALEVGTGSGYQAAVLSKIINEVYTIEIFEELGIAAKKRLSHLGYSNVKVRIDDGYYGWPERAPFDVVVVTCAVDHIPPSLIEQLKEGGRMCLPLGSPFLTQTLMLVEKKNGQVVSRSILPVRFVPLLGKH